MHSLFRPLRFLRLAVLAFWICPSVGLRAEVPTGALLCADGEIVGCGKAQAMIARLTAEREPPEPPMPREAMTDTDVLHCDLDIEVTNINTGAGTCTLTGTNVMTIRSKSPSLTQFTFRLRDNYTITSLVVTDGGNDFPVSHTLVPNRTRIVTLNRTYGMDEEFLLTIAYTGNSVSLGFGSITVATQGGTPIVASLSEPYYAYSWWPAKDGDVATMGDNSDKATFDLSVTVPAAYTVPSNGLLQGVDDLSGSRRRFRWATNYPMTTYLLSFAATTYNTWTLSYNYPAGDTYPAGSMPVEFYIFPGNDNPTNRNAWGNCVNMLGVFRTVFGEYPFLNEKYGIYNFTFGGGMEHQTMTGQGTFSESVTAHELGHQWWGDMITCQTWGDIWLNEGFATYSECLWEERKGGGINSTAYFTAINNRRPTNNGIDGSAFRYDVSSASTIFNSTYAYQKGAWVLHMLRHAVGSDATFFQVLADYREAMQYSAALTTDFNAIASATSGKDLTAFFNQWVFNRGAPSYRIGWTTTNVAGQNYLLARLEQLQTATAGSPPQVLSVYQMPVDLRVTIGGSPQTLVVDNDARTEWFVVPTSGPVTALVVDPDNWILRPAVASTGYVPGPPKIVGVSPAPGEQALSPPAQISVTFHTPVNCTAANFSLVGDNVGPRSFTLVSGSNVNPAVLNLSGPLPPDDYTLTVTSGVSAVNSGMALDGEIVDPDSPASLPSGDGVAGGNAVLRFTVVPCQVLGDIDGDCDKDQTDIDLFADVLLGVELNPAYVTASDLDNSGTPDGDDVQAMTDAMLAP